VIIPIELIGGGSFEIVPRALGLTDEEANRRLLSEDEETVRALVQAMCNAALRLNSVQHCGRC